MTRQIHGRTVYADRLTLSAQINGADLIGVYMNARTDLSAHCSVSPDEAEQFANALLELVAIARQGEQATEPTHA